MAAPAWGTPRAETAAAAKAIVEKYNKKAVAAGKPKAGGASDRMMRWEAMAGGYNDNNRNSAPRSSISKEGPGRKIERTPSKIGRDLLALAANVAAAEAAAEGAAEEAAAEGGTPPGTPPREQAIWTHPQESARMLQQAVARHDEKEAAALSARGGVPDVELTV